MTIFMLFNLAFHHFFDWRDPKSTNCKKLDFKTFLEKMRFFAICGFEKIDQKQSRRSLRSSLHNELSPFIHEVKLVSPPFWGSTLFVSIPFGITNINAKKNCEKVCTEKNYTHIFGPSQDPNPWTSKMYSFCVLVP